MKYYITILLLAISFNILGHGGHKAFFTLQSHNQQLVLTVKMEVHDIETELKQKEYTYGNLAQGFEKYLEDHFSCSVNGKSIELAFSSSYTNKGYIVVTCHSNKITSDIQIIKIKNTCFEDYDHAYQNILRINISDTDATYKMTKQRNQITHNIN